MRCTSAILGSILAASGASFAQADGFAFSINLGGGGWAPAPIVAPCRTTVVSNCGPAVTACAPVVRTGCGTAVTACAPVVTTCAPVVACSRPVIVQPVVVRPVHQNGWHHRHGWRHAGSGASHGWRR